MAFVPTSTLSFCNTGEHGFKQTVRKMGWLNKKKDPGVETVSPQEGSQQFLFQPVDGLHYPVNIFYDKGCLEAVFRDGIYLAAE